MNYAMLLPGYGNRLFTTSLQKFFLPQPGGTPQVFTVKEKGKCLSFSVDLGSKKKAYMQIPNALSSMSENMVQMNTEVEEKDSFVVLPEIMIGPPIPESVTGGGTVWRRRWVKTGAGL